MSVPSPYAAKLGRIPTRERTMAVLGSETHYWEYGDPVASATTVVMVHGFRGDHHGLEPVVAQLPDLHIVSPDLPGFGASTPLGSSAPLAPSEPVGGIHHDIAGYGRWLRAFVAGLELSDRRLIILGHSFGSIVVAGTLASRTETDTLRPNDVVLVNPIAAPALSGPRGVFTRLAVFYYWLSAVLPEKLGFGLLRNRGIVRVMSVTMAKTKNSSLRRWIHEEHDRYFSAFSDRRVVLEAFRASVSHDVSEYASGIPERTLLIAADKDDITPVAEQEKLRTIFADAELFVIKDVGHLIHYEVPEQAAAELARFLGAGN